MFYSAIRKVLFKFDPEAIHEMTIKGFKATGSSPLNLLYKQSIADKPVEAMGIKFPNPVGLAAGLDKNGECINAFAAMGFGFVEMALDHEGEIAINELHGSKVGKNKIRVKQSTE